MEHTISITNLCKNFKSTKALNRISFEAKEGRVTAFLGPNGAGKSTTLRILLGLDTPSSGQTSIEGIQYSDISNPLTLIGASFDGVGAPNDRTVYQHLKILAVSNGINLTRINEVLEITNIKHKSSSRIGTLSLGEGQRVGIATALLGNPQYLILDEPTNGLDPQGIRWFREFIKIQAVKGKTVLLSSHILSEVEAVADDVVIINQGVILAKGTLSDVLNKHACLEDVFFELTNTNDKKEFV